MKQLSWYKKACVSLVMVAMLFAPVLATVASIATVASVPVLLTGCKKGVVNVENVAPTLVPIMDRHDAYVKADATKDEATKTVLLSRTERLRAKMQAALEDNGKIKVTDVSIDFVGALATHDAYVNADANVTALEKRIYLRSSAILLRLHNEAIGKKESKAGD